MARPPLPRAELSTSLGQDVFLLCFFLPKVWGNVKNTPHFGPHVRKCITSWGNTNPSTIFSIIWGSKSQKNVVWNFDEKSWKYLYPLGLSLPSFSFQTPIFFNFFPKSPKVYIPKKLFCQKQVSLFLEQNMFWASIFKTRVLSGVRILDLSHHILGAWLQSFKKKASKTLNCLRFQRRKKNHPICKSHPPSEFIWILGNN